MQDVTEMFNGCAKLAALDVSHFNTSNVTKMNSLFCNCTSLTNLDVSSWNVSNVEEMRYLFYNCKSLKAIDLTKWNTAKLNYVSSMFCGCSSLTELDLSKLNVNYAEYGSYMFENCTKLAKLSLSSSMESLNTGACAGVGTATEPCRLFVPEGFTFAEDIDTSAEVFSWCKGYFTLGVSYLLGDVNHDGIINVTDVTLLVDYILGNRPAVFFEDSADCDQNGSISVADVTQVVDLILSNH